MLGKILLLFACVCQFAMAADDLPLLTVEVYDQTGVRITGEAKLQLVSGRSGEDSSARLTNGQGRVPEGSYRLEVFVPGFITYRETVHVNAPSTGVRVGLALGIIADPETDSPPPTTEVISGYVDSKLSKDRDLWVQAYAIFRPQEQGRVVRINRHGEFTIHVPVRMRPWLLTVVEMSDGSFRDRSKTFEFPRAVGATVVHWTQEPVKIDLH